LPVGTKRWARLLTQLSHDLSSLTGGIPETTSTAVEPTSSKPNYTLLSLNNKGNVNLYSASKGALHRLNQIVKRLVKCARVARSPDRRLKLT